MACLSNSIQIKQMHTIGCYSAALHTTSQLWPQLLCCATGLLYIQHRNCLLNCFVLATLHHWNSVNLMMLFFVPLEEFWNAPHAGTRLQKRTLIIWSSGACAPHHAVSLYSQRIFSLRKLSGLPKSHNMISPRTGIICVKEGQHSTV